MKTRDAHLHVNVASTLCTYMPMVIMIVHNIMFVPAQGGCQRNTPQSHCCSIWPSLHSLPHQGTSCGLPLVTLDSGLDTCLAHLVEPLGHWQGLSTKGSNVSLWSVSFVYTCTCTCTLYMYIHIVYIPLAPDNPYIFVRKS